MTSTKEHTHAFLSSDPEKLLSIDKGKADAALAFITKQIKTKLDGDGATKEYLFILEKLQSQRNEDKPLMPTIYLGLARNASAICDDKQNLLTDLCDAIFSFNWLAVGTPTSRQCFAFLLTNLVSSNSCFLLPAFKVLISCFSPVEEPPPVPSAGSMDPQTPSTSIGEDRDDDLDLVHAVINRVVALVPRSIGILTRVLNENFPHKSQSLTLQVAYLRNLCRIADETAVCFENIMAVIVEHMVDIDVEIKLDANDAVTTVHPHAMHHNSTATTTPAAVSSTATADETANAVSASTDNKQTEMAAKLDAMMVVMFQYLKCRMEGARRTISARRTPAVASPAGAASADAVSTSWLTPAIKAQEATLRTFLKIFENSILSTHKSKYIQFLVFFLLHYAEHFPDMFVGCVVNHIASHDSADIIKQTGVAYCASFVSRASFVHISTVQSTLAFLWKWASRYTRRFRRNTAAGRSPAPPGTAAHSVFYAVCQGIFYIVCFKARSIAALGAPGRAFLAQWAWDDLVNSPLRPLQFCLESVRLEFPSALRAVLPDVVLRIPGPLAAGCGLAAVGVNHGNAANAAASRSPRSASSPAAVSQRAGAHYGRLGAGAGSRANPLDSFFPFDPYLLWESSAFIDSLYQDWEPMSPPAAHTTNDSVGGGGCLTTDEEDDGGDDGDTISVEGDDDDGEGENEDDDDDDDDHKQNVSGGLRLPSQNGISMLPFDDDDSGTDSEGEGDDEDEGVEHVEYSTTDTSSRSASATGAYSRFVSRW